MLSHEELYHYGVKGMRWGIRNAYAKGAERSTSKKDAERAKADAHTKRKRELQDGPLTIGRGRKIHIERRKAYEAESRARTHGGNARRRQIITKAMDKTITSKNFDRYAKAYNQGVKNNFLHPILSDRAWRESKAASRESSFATALRRATLYSTTKEIEDVNARTARMLKEKKKS